MDPPSAIPRKTRIVMKPPKSDTSVIQEVLVLNNCSPKFVTKDVMNVMKPKKITMVGTGLT